MSENLRPHNVGHFQDLLAVVFIGFGILYVGHAFPAFRSKESTISYLMVPASALEKFVFEFVSRICIALVTLPLLYWLTFNIQGYFFEIFSDEIFRPVGIQYLVKLDVPPDLSLALYSMIAGGILLGLSLAFTGAAMFTKQPLVKSLFALAMLVIFFVGYSYLVVVHLGVGEFNPPDHTVLVPMNEDQGFKMLTVAFFASAGVMLFVAFRKLKEREV